MTEYQLLISRYQQIKEERSKATVDEYKLLDELVRLIEKQKEISYKLDKLKVCIIAETNKVKELFKPLSLDEYLTQNIQEEW